jgi:hypothetical protein
MGIGHVGVTLKVRVLFQKAGNEVFSWFTRSQNRRRVGRDDKKLLAPGVRRFLEDYLSASEQQKKDYYAALAGASDGCMPKTTFNLDSFEIARKLAESAVRVVRWRQNSEIFNEGDQK